MIIQCFQRIDSLGLEFGKYEVSEPLEVLGEIERVCSLGGGSKIDLLLLDVDFNLVEFGAYFIRIDLYFIDLG